MLNHRQIISQMTWEIFTFGPSLHHRTKSKRLQNQPEWRLLPQDTPAFSLVCFKVGLYYNRLLKHYRGWTQASLTGQGVALGTPEQVKSKASSCQAEEHRGGGTHWSSLSPTPSPTAVGDTSPTAPEVLWGHQWFYQNKNIKEESKSEKK